MEFELTQELADQIVFAMENQNEFFCLDTDTLTIVSAERSKENPERFIRIPDWKPSDGFYLMEKFISLLRNPVFREKLKSCLSEGRGVFRKFKNILKEREDIERLWFNFKDKEMNARVSSWYNDFCEFRGYNALVIEPEETSDLILSDFMLTEGVEDWGEKISEYEKISFYENLSALPVEEIDLYYLNRKGSLTPVTKSSVILKAETALGDLAGFVRGEETGNSGIRIFQFFVVENYRGLGLGNLLLEQYCKILYKRDIIGINFELVGKALDFKGKLELLGFSPRFTDYNLDLAKWGAENDLE